MQKVIIHIDLAQVLLGQLESENMDITCLAACKPINNHYYAFGSEKNRLPLTGREGKEWFTRREQVGHGGQGALHCGRGTDTGDLQHPQERLPTGLKTLRQILELCGCEGPSPPTSKGHIEDGSRGLCLEPLETWILITRNFHGFMAIRFL